MPLTLRTALCLSPLALFALAPACGARSDVTPPDTFLHSQGGGGSGSSSITGSVSSTGVSSVSSTSVVSSSASSSSSSSGSITSPVVSMYPGSFMQSETSVAAAAGGFVAVAWIDVSQVGTTNMGYTFSTDDGASFGLPLVLAAPDGRLSSDPVLATDAKGNFYLTWVGYFVDAMGNPSDMHIYVSTAPAGTTKFGAPVEASDPTDTTSTYDKPWITVTNDGTVLVTYESAQSQFMFGLTAARSTDGVNWQRSTIASDSTGNAFRNLAFPCAPRNGSRIWVTYLVLDLNALHVELVYSDDSGATWSPEVQVDLPGEPVSFDDPNCVAEQNDVWVSYGLTHDMLDPNVATMSKLFAIRLAHSGDGGQTIDTRIDAEDTAAAPFFLHPQIALEDSGAIDLVYYAGQQDEDAAGTYRRSRAATPAGGFSPSVVLDAPLTYLQSRGDQRWLGDYTGVCWRAGELYTSFAENLSGISDIAFAKAAAP